MVMADRGRAGARVVRVASAGGEWTASNHRFRSSLAELAERAKSDCRTETTRRSGPTPIQTQRRLSQADIDALVGEYRADRTDLKDLAAQVRRAPNDSCRSSRSRRRHGPAEDSDGGADIGSSPPFMPRDGRSPGLDIASASIRRASTTDSDRQAYDCACGRGVRDGLPESTLHPRRRSC